MTFRSCARKVCHSDSCLSQCWSVLSCCCRLGWCRGRQHMHGTSILWRWYSANHAIDCADNYSLLFVWGKCGPLLNLGSHSVELWFVVCMAFSNYLIQQEVWHLRRGGSRQLSGHVSLREVACGSEVACLQVWHVICLPRCIVVAFVDSSMHLSWLKAHALRMHQNLVLLVGSRMSTMIA